MTTKEALIAAKALIDTPDRWCQGMNRNGNAFCARGALYEATAKLDERCPAWQALIDALPKSAHGWVTRYNDTHSHKAVMRWFDRAIEAAS